MSKMKYSLVPKTNRSTGEIRAYANAVNDEFTLNDLSKQVAAETTVSQADVKAVIEALVKTVIRRVSDGLTVKLGDLGSIYPTFESEGTDKVDDWTPSMIKAVRVRFL